MTITAIIAIVFSVIGGMTLSAIALAVHRPVYRPSRWLRVVLLLTAVCMFGIALGYIAILFEVGERLMIQAFWLRPLASFIYVSYAAMAMYTLRQAWAYENMRQEFIQTAAHELRTPLTIIWGFADILTSFPGDIPVEAMMVYLTSIRKQCGILGDHVRDILYFEKSRYPELLPMKPVDLTALVVETVQTIAEAVAGPAGVQISIDNADVVTVNGHVNKIRLILYNLIINAVKFSPPDSTGGTVSVSLFAVGDTAVISIADTGVGISPAFMPLLFQPFQQERADVRRPFSGTGMGLAAAAAIAETQGAKITVTSELGKGSTFRVVLPLGEHAG